MASLREHLVDRVCQFRHLFVQVLALVVVLIALMVVSLDVAQPGSATHAVALLNVVGLAAIGGSVLAAMAVCEV